MKGERCWSINPDGAAKKKLLNNRNRRVAGAVASALNAPESAIIGSNEALPQMNEKAVVGVTVGLCANFIGEQELKRGDALRQRVTGPWPERRRVRLPLPHLRQWAGAAMTARWKSALLGVAAALLSVCVPTQAATVDGSSTEISRLSYASVSDEDLTAIAARWDDLNAQQRRALLSEVKLRMKRSGGAERVLRANTSRRYGTVARHANGARATLRVEVRAVKQRDKRAKGNQDYGVGFERRARQDRAAPEVADPEAPVVRVADPE